MSILIGLAHEPVFNAAVATQIVFQQPVRAGRKFVELIARARARARFQRSITKRRPFSCTA
ncbi:hypothetical protein FVE88_03980 [Ectopseudomonas mendocina]|nr:hypothetical protein FVE88_03980 [Pseudomonas mendocina]